MRAADATSAPKKLRLLPAVIQTDAGFKVFTEDSKQ
jgi:hypothetical protein